MRPEAVKRLHNKGVSPSVYIDDWLLWDRSPKTLKHHTSVTVNLLQRLGFTLNLKKSQLEPSPTITYLGISWSGTNHTLLPGSKALEKVSTTAPGSPAAALSPLEALSKAPGLHQLCGTIHRVRAPTPQADHSDLPQLQRQEISPSIAAVSATHPMVDPEKELGGPCSHVHPASKHDSLDRRLENRVGGVSSLGSTVSGVWSHEESLLHINTLECLAVTRSLLRLDPPKDSVILVRTDNTVVVSLINKQGSNKSKVLSRFLHDLLALCARNRWIIRSRHLPGHLNTWADSLSRSHPVRAEWSLSPQSFQQLTTHLSPEIDLFAHPGNAKLPTFGCPFPFPSATVVDALATNWNRWKKIYLFPPPDLIQTCLQKLENFGGSALVIVPVLPSAPWWPEFRLVCTPLDVDLDIGQWVQGEWLKAQEKTSYLFRTCSISRTSTPEAPVTLALSTAHRGSTRDQYEHCWKDFQQWLTSNPTKPISKGSVLLYLNYLVQARRLSPKTVLVYRNALKLPLLHGFNIDTSDREFSLLARGQFLQNPPLKKLIPAWNPNKVLSMLEQPEFLNHRATSHRLLIKTLFLIALATVNLVSEIATFTRVGSKILPGSKESYHRGQTWFSL